MIHVPLKSRPLDILGTLCLTAIIGILDYITGIDINFFAFYYIPIAIAAWYIDRKWTIFIAILSAFTWTAIDILSNHHYPHWSFFFWNGGIRFISFIIFGLGLFMIRKLLKAERELARNLQTTLDEIKTLKGFLPICSSCKNIRNDKGYWEKIEQYIASHSEAEFTHTLCPDCLKKLYPDIDTSSKK